MQSIPASVMAAFDVRGEAQLLAGGKGGTWRVGDVILKPAEGEAETRWRAETVVKLAESTAYRLARPRRTVDGDWIGHGWEAQEVVAGHPDQRRVDDVLHAGIAFHRTIAALPRPSFLADRNDPWAYGDRLAWGAESPRRRSHLVEGLLAARQPVDVQPQVVHGDLLGNVLFADGLPPAIIDWTAYWRPTAWAYAVAVIDGLTWHGVEPAVLQRWSHLPHWDQMLIRALIYRIATWDAAGWSAEPEAEYAPVVDRVLARLTSGE